MKQAALNTFAALAVAALCAGAVFVGYDYLRDDNDDAPIAAVADESTDAENTVETDTPTDTTVAPPPRDPAAQDRAYSYLADIGVSLPAVESVVRAALSDDPMNPDVYVRLRDNNPDPSERVAPECPEVGEPFIVIDVVDFVVVDAIDLCTPEAPDLEERQEFFDCVSIALPSDPPVIVEDCDGEISNSLAISDALAELDVTLPMGEAEFVNRAEASGYSVRVVARDGEYFDLTMDYSDTRLNVEVVDRQVVKVVDIG